MGRDEVKARHAHEAEKARQLYLQSKTPTESEISWHQALAQAREMIGDALRASHMLKNVTLALAKSGEHMRVYRQLTAPPISQDQFNLICPEWKKASEKKGRKLNLANAQNVAAKFDDWRDKKLTRWLDENRKPRFREIRRLFDAVGPLIASQEISTVERNRRSAQQEFDVIRCLEAQGWIKEPSRPIKSQPALAPKHFMHKTRFATKNQPQEVDIACGLKNTHVLAMECKVTNDATNSVKRVNDILKKATAWKDHWGNFIVTAALLQGVIAAKDVNRLLDAEVRVFWSHDLATFESWLSAQL